MHARKLVSSAVILGLLVPAAFVSARDQTDLQVVYRIKQEAFKRSKVMNHLFYMTDVYGPRLTNSPGYDAAADWAVEELRSWGLDNVRIETWESFGRGWSTSHFEAHLVEPQYAPLIGVPLAWTPGTDGVVSGTPILAPFDGSGGVEEFEAELKRFMEAHRGKLKGALLMIEEPRKVEEGTRPASHRFSSGELAEMTQAPELIEPLEIDLENFDPENFEMPKSREERRRFFRSLPWYLREKLSKRMRPLRDRLNQFLVDEGVGVVITTGFRGDGGTIFPSRAGSRHVDSVAPPPSIALTPEHYNRIARLVEKGLPCRVEVEVKARFHEDDLDGANVLAEIPGGAKKDELVMIGAHYDDVVYATGATDNAAGCAVMMEAMRILKVLDLEMDRTVRLALWDGEEQGLLGSKAYVEEHFADPVTMELRPEHEKFSVYFNLDNGTGKIRGVYLQENDMARPILSSWLSPFKDLGASTVTIRNTGGTDHQAFDRVGLPGFQFIQDPVEYRSRTHHSNMDFYDRVQAGDLMQASAIVASLVYHAANREERFPRKPLPEAVPEEMREEDP